MTGNLLTTRKFAFPAATIAATFALFGSALGATANAETGLHSASANTPTVAFVDEFMPFEALPPAPQPAAHVVDIDTFDPPIEVEPEPDTRMIGTGIASYYGKRFQGRRTANGERFDMNAMTAAHKTLPFGTKVEVTNPRNGKSVTVRINDRGPYAHGRMIDLSRAAAKEIGLVQRGHGKVELAKIVS